MTQLCEYEGCRRAAEGYVEAQWTPFDFVRYEGCPEHVWLMRAELSQRYVELDQPVVRIAWYWYDPTADNSLDPSKNVLKTEGTSGQA